MTTTDRPANADAAADAAVKAKHRAMWASGDYPALAHDLIADLGPALVDACGVRPGMRVLDVAAGAGNAALVAADAGADVVAADLTPELFAAGRAAAAERGVEVTWREADAEALPFADDSFDVVLSTFGVMFTPNQEQAAAELVRVVRKGGRIGLASWTPDGFIGQLFKTLSQHVPPPAAIRSPALWGTRARLAELFPGHHVSATNQVFHFRYKSPLHWLEIFKTCYGPMQRAFASLDTPKQTSLETDILALLERMNRGPGGTLIVPGEYLEAVITKQ